MPRCHSRQNSSLNVVSKCPCLKFDLLQVHWLASSATWLALFERVLVRPPATGIGLKKEGTSGSHCQMREMDCFQARGQASRQDAGASADGGGSWVSMPDSPTYTPHFPAGAGCDFHHTRAMCRVKYSIFHLHRSLRSGRGREALGFMKHFLFQSRSTC